MAKTLPLIPCREARVAGPSDSIVLDLPEVASSTHAVGAIVGIDANGFVAEVAKTATTTVKILGIALTPGNNAAASSTNKTKVLILSPHSECLFNLRDNGGAAAYDATDHVLAQTDIGIPLYVQGVAGGKYSLSLSAPSGSSSQAFTAVQIHPDSAVGDTNAWVYAVPLSSMLQHA